MRALLLFVLVCLIVPAALPGADQQVTDDVLYDTVRRKLANDRDVKGGAIEVEVREGVVTMRGKVREEKQKAKAERIVRKVKGVKNVVNELRVGTAID